MHNQGNHKESEKTAHRMGENICKWCSKQRINFQYIQAAHTAQCQKADNPIKKQTEELNRHFPQRNTDRQQAHEKMLNITNYYRNENQTYEVSPHISQNDHHQKSLQIISSGEDVKKKEASYTVGGNVNGYSHFGEWYGVSQKN